ncbi:MAG: hypothetical protein FJX74_06380 [Armatimonadetes bacterium]|nr:hypothetical protein [Armatimonadota bacterium]
MFVRSALLLATLAGGLSTSALPQTVAELIAEFGANEGPVRVSAREALATLGPEAVAPLLSAIAANPPPVEQPVGQALLLLTHRWSDSSARRGEVSEALLEAAAGLDDTVARRFALYLLGQVADESVTPFVVELLHDPDVAFAACDCLQQIPGTSPTAALAVALEWAPPELQVALLRALGRRADRRSALDVRRLLGSVDPAVRAAATAVFPRVLFGGRPLDERAVSPGFRQVRLVDGASLVEACTILDVNRDGRPDIASGGFWYEAPAWTPHAYREVTNDGSYANDWGEYALDVDADGWTDIVSGGFHTAEISWYRNPRGQAGPWPKHLAWSRGDEFYETVVMVDLDGDGQGDFLPNAGAPIRWFEVVRREGAEPEFVRHDIGGEGAGHGLGYGDVNLDGRLDVLTPSGWYEAPEDRRAGEWTWHGEFSLGSTSVPILAHDLNDDGLSDILWGGGHGYGLFALLQQREGDARTWQPQTLDGSFSQAHAPALADLDGDGRLDIVVGKRWKAHCGRDPGTDDPLYVYGFSSAPGAGLWRRWVISYNEGAGIGLQQSIVDLDNDGDLDIVSACKTGLFVLLGELPE